MRLFSPLYARVMNWSRHRHAHRYLAALSFAESSFFPVPPDVLLAPMTLARPEQGWRLAFFTTLASVAGGILGYTIGWFALDAVEPLLRSAGYWEDYERASAWFERWGFWAVLVAGFSPIPYKIFTIAAGALRTWLPVFIVASFLGRGARFFLVAGLLIWGGERMERQLKRHVDTIGWLTVAAIAIAYLVIQFR
ncbi:YqaA family protein [Candidatus Rariloculus sp.]|uniref:YqaA family protein n=1 Tax=Candidatus Rariloculus sp. TaxID=3101265 RepID=UPI003D0DDAC4